MKNVKFRGYPAVDEFRGKRIPRLNSAAQIPR